MTCPTCHKPMLSEWPHHHPMTEPGGVGTPETEAGRMLARSLAHVGGAEWVTNRVLAIEAEATRAERERLQEEIDHLTEKLRRCEEAPYA